MSELKSHRVPPVVLGAGALAICVVALRYGCAGRQASEELAAGVAQVRVDGERVSIHARNAERDEILGELARSGHFSVIYEEPIPGQVTLDLDSVTVPFALALIVQDRRYAIHFAPGASTPDRIEVGEVRSKVNQHVSGDSVGSGQNHATVDNTRSLPNAPSQAPSGAAAIFDPNRRSQRLQDLQSDDPERRAQAVKVTPPVGTGSTQLEQALLSDPDVRVRTEAARQLGGSEGYASTHALIRALEDDDPGVGAAAAEALVDKGDPSVCPALRDALRRDLDESVERAVQKAIADLQYTKRPHPESPDIMEAMPAPKGTPLPDDHGTERPSGT